MIAADASAVVSALIDAGGTGRWASQLLAGQSVVAPHLMPAEVSNILRRTVAAKKLSRNVAVIALGQLMDIRQTLVPYRDYADRVWELRENFTAYDAWYVAVAEDFRVPLATTDLRLTRAPGTRCDFLTPG